MYLNSALIIKIEMAEIHCMRARRPKKMKHFADLVKNHKKLLYAIGEL
jgi:hypothetical protein